MSKLSSGRPATTAGPLSPPRSANRFESQVEVALQRLAPAVAIEAVRLEDRPDILLERQPFASLDRRDADEAGEGDHQETGQAVGHRVSRLQDRLLPQPHVVSSLFHDYCQIIV